MRKTIITVLHDLSLAETYFSKLQFIGVLELVKIPLLSTNVDKKHCSFWMSRKGRGTHAK